MGGRDESEKSLTLRRMRLASSLRRKGVSDPRVLNAIGEVPREQFVDQGLRDEAYRDSPLPIGKGQTISQPYVVALMTEALALTGAERVLEVGTGSGYQTAILCALAQFVVSIERFAGLAQAARDRLRALGHGNFAVHVADGTQGWPDEAPYDAIVVAAAAPRLPEPLLAQLAAGGRCVIPVGDRHSQALLCVEHHGERAPQRNLGCVRFVPLVGAHGWSDEGE